MRVLITGASGFIGRNLLLQAPAHWQVTAVYHRDRTFASFVRARQAHGIRAVACDLASPREVARLAARVGRSFDTLIYLAGHVDPGRSVEVPLSDLQANTIALLNTLEYFRAGRCIFFSSGAVYEGLRGSVSPRSPVSPTLPYAIAKVAGEQYVKFYTLRRRHMGRYVILRFFGAFGPHEPSRKIYTRLVQAFGLEGHDAFTIRGDGTNQIDAMYVDDAVHGLLRVVQQRAVGNVTVDFANARPLTIRALVERAARTFGRARVRLRCAGPTQEALHCRASRHTMLRQFGFAPRIRLEDGLQRLAEFLRQSSTCRRETPGCPRAGGSTPGGGAREGAPGGRTRRMFSA